MLAGEHPVGDADDLCPAAVVAVKPDGGNAVAAGKFVEQFRTAAGETVHCLVRVADGQQLGVHGIVEAQGLHKPVKAGGEILVLVNVKVGVLGRQGPADELVLFDELDRGRHDVVEIDEPLAAEQRLVVAGSFPDFLS